jgi:truncated hemoglobin YjbI
MTVRSRTLRHAAAAVLLAALCAGASLAPSHAQSGAAARQTLYQRLGGYDGVHAYVALVFPRVAQHPDLVHLFRGHGKDSQQRQFQMVVELICQRTGGPCAYTGRPMVPFMQIIRTGLDEKRYPPDVRDEFLAVWSGFRGGVVQK